MANVKVFVTDRRTDGWTDGQTDGRMRFNVPALSRKRGTKSPRYEPVMIEKTLYPVLMTLLEPFKDFRSVTI